MRANFDLSQYEKIDWLSPLKKDDYAEYRDEAVFDLLGIYIDTIAKRAFWAEMEPQWDGIGKTHEKVFLVEAKSHIPELISSLKATNPVSIKTIADSLESTKKELGSKTDFDWSKTFYQYTNRLAHVNFLRHLDIPTYLVNVYFVNDLEMNGPTTIDEWKGAIKLLHRCLGLKEHLPGKFVVDVFVDVNDLSDS